jgi:hypothetical protein
MPSSATRLLLHASFAAPFLLQIGVIIGVFRCLYNEFVAGNAPTCDWRVDALWWQAFAFAAALAIHIALSGLLLKYQPQRLLFTSLILVLLSELAVWSEAAVNGPREPGSIEEWSRAHGAFNMRFATMGMTVFLFLNSIYSRWCRPPPALVVVDSGVPGRDPDVYVCNM